MNIGEAKLKSLNHIPTEEVRKDLEEAKEELRGYIARRDLLNPQLQTDKVEHYFLEGKIAKGKEFIDELNQILDYRETGNIRI